MNLLPIILYLLGIVGIVISLILIVFAIKKGKRSSLSLILATFLLSIFLMASSSGITFLQNMNISSEESTEEQSTEEISTQPINKEINVKEALIDDLKVEYKLTSSRNTSGKHAEIVIENKSDSIFNGEIKIIFEDSNNQITDTLILPIKNFMPSTSYKPTALVSGNAANVEYSFSGTFNKDIDTSIPFTIRKITMGNNFFRFDVATDDISSQNLKNICDQFANQYGSNLCDGFLIYFYPSSSSEKSNFNNAVGDFYLDNISTKSKLTIY